MLRMRTYPWIAMVCVTGCTDALDVHLIRYPESAGLADRGKNCAVRLLEWESALADDCREVGDVFVGDTGHSIDCDEQRVLAEIVSASCRIGADTAVARRIRSVGMTCYHEQEPPSYPWAPARRRSVGLRR